MSVPRILKVEAETIRSEANYAVFRTKPDELSTVFNVGRYLDTIRRTDEGLKFESRVCVFDGEMIPNSLIYPI
ncbi:aromatic-ring-hydroxylating dioxygenase subunit beta [Caballeronia udeis]|uniref:Aromatic-ring-hydroxylating dioxygenase subunit beta n=1 Tax=Caballeronia udeis TaxID=1232866 RepID=A0A158HYE4_9BURK|nr:aromatic-ring-hydroxylating dioxygenase subunit beta [Caballeronia udeis]